MLASGFYNMDCMEAMKEFPDKFFDLAIVDPPYGINVGSASMGAGGGGGSSQESVSGKRKKRIGGGYRTIGGSKPFGKNPSGGRPYISPKIYKAFDDSHTPDAAYFSELRRVAKNCIIWGGNYFLEYLGATECLIVWDKKRRGINFADCEIAWTNIKQPCRVFEFLWNGMLQGDMKNKEHRIHPTQKPVALYKWILQNYAKEGDKILDTHVGSASSLIACYDMGFEYWGFEIDEDYYKMASERLAEEMAQIRMF